MLGGRRSDFMLEAACQRAQSVLLDPAIAAGRRRDVIRQLDAP
jgi:uncharacterized protein (DUF1778 family)